METLQIAETQEARYQDWHLGVDFERRLASVDYRPVKLTRKEYELLAYLVRNAGQVVPSETLLSRVFGYSPEARTRTLHVHVRRLREKLGAYRAEYIETIFGVGYRFQPYRPAMPLKEPVGYGAPMPLN